MGRYLRPIGALAVAALVVAAIVHAGLFDDFSVAGMRARIEAWGAFGPLVFMGIMVAGFFVPGPEIVLVALGGAIFGGWQGFAYSWMAAVVGTALPFLLVRQAIGRYVQGPDGVRFARLRAIDERLARHGFATVVLLRLGLYLAPPLNWALGATRVTLRDFVLGTAVGVVPTTAITVYLGDAVTDAGSAAELLGAQVLVPLALVGGLLVAGAVVGRRLFGGQSS